MAAVVHQHILHQYILEMKDIEADMLHSHPLVAILCTDFARLENFTMLSAFAKQDGMQLLRNIVCFHFVLLLRAQSHRCTE